MFHPDLEHVASQLKILYLTTLVIGRNKKNNALKKFILSLTLTITDAATDAAFTLLSPPASFVMITPGILVVVGSTVVYTL